MEKQYCKTSLVQLIKLTLLIILFIVICFSTLLWGKIKPYPKWISTLVAKKPNQTIITAVGDLIFTKKISHLKKTSYTNLYKILDQKLLSETIAHF